MRLVHVVLSICLLAGAAFADTTPLDCGTTSLARVVARTTTPISIAFTGVCSGPIVIRTDGLTLTGVGNAIIDGDGKDAVTVAGAHGVSLANFAIRDGLSGLVGTNGAHISVTGVESRENALFGISLQTASSAVLSGVTTRNNGLHGLDLETGSAATITGSFNSSNNRVFGINVNGSSLTFARAEVSVSGNALGIQIATGANAFINDSATVLNVTNNLATGLTVVSGAHMVSFGGSINASGNPVNGVSVNSKGGLDLDAASTLNSYNNGDGILVQEASVMTVFNNPQFSGVPGFTTINCHDNTGTGLKLETGSTLTLSNQAKITSTANGQAGLLADNGIGLTLVNSTFTGNTTKDLLLTFGTRADLSSLTFGTYACDATVLVRGTSGITCPH